jgi:hypothetical protein
MAATGTIGYRIEGASAALGGTLDARGVATHKEKVGGSRLQRAKRVLGATFRPLHERNDSAEAVLSLDVLGIKSPYAVTDDNALVLGLDCGSARGNGVLE